MRYLVLSLVLLPLLAFLLFSGDPNTVRLGDCNWTTFPTLATGAHRNNLQSIASLSANDVWAVGYHEPTKNGSTLTAHWNGTNWSIIPSPSVGISNTFLMNIVAVSPNQIWATGYYSASTEVTKPFLIRWNGQNWQRQTVPDFGERNIHLLSVSATSPNNLWVAGYEVTNEDARSTFLLRWDGAHWDEFAQIHGDSFVQASLGSVIVRSPNDVWAIGSHGAAQIALHWDGTSMQEASRLYFNGVYFRVTDALIDAANEGWAVGYSGFPPFDRKYDYVVLRYHSGGWIGSDYPSVGYGDSALSGVSRAPNGAIWFAGHYDTQTAAGIQPLILRRYNDVWQAFLDIGRSPNIVLKDIDASNSVGVWAVGNYSSTVASNTYIIRSNGECLPPTPIIPTATPIPFVDVHPEDYFYQAVQYLASHQIISGYPDRTFRPYMNASRGQIMKMVVAAVDWPLVYPNVPRYRDVTTDNVFYPYIETAALHSIVNGFPDGTFRPGQDVSRQQLSKIVVGAMGWKLVNPISPTFNDVPTGNIFYGYIEAAAAHQIINGYECGAPEPCPGRYFRPSNKATRGQISKIVYLAVTR